MVKDTDRDTVILVARKILRINQADWNALSAATKKEELTRAMRAIKGMEKYKQNVDEKGPQIGGISDPKAVKQIGRIVYEMNGDAWAALSSEEKVARKNDCRRIMTAVEHHLKPNIA
jgi:hypothetical protein